MVNVTVTTIPDPTRALALSYAPRHRRAGLAALFALDDALGQVLRTTREALVMLDSAPPPAEPVLQALTAEALPIGITGRAVAAIVDGWEPLLGTIDDAAIEAHARLRGGVLFAQAGAIVGAASDDPLDSAGQGWALADLAAHLSDAALASHARAAALPLLNDACRHRWSRNARALGALAHSARMNMSGPATPWSVARLAWHRMTGR